MSQVVLGVLKLGAMSTVPQVIVWTLPSEEFELTKMSRGDHDIFTAIPDTITSLQHHFEAAHLTHDDINW